MINNNQKNYVQEMNLFSELKEKIHCNVQKTIFKDDYINSNEFFELRIRRLIETDQIILEFIFVNGHYLINNPIIKSSIDNNEITFNKLNNSNKSINIYQAILPTITNWKTFTFDKFKNIYFEIYNNIGQKRKKLEKLYSLNYKFQFENISNQNLKMNKNGSKISLLSLLKFKFYNDENVEQSLEDNSDYQYLIYEFKPNILKFGEYLETIYDVLSYKKWKSSNQKINILDKTDYSGFKVKNETSNELISGKFELKSYGKNNIEKINIVSYSYYDKNSKKTLITPDNDLSRKGLILPLSLSGNFNMKVNVTFGKNNENITLNYLQFFNKAFFSGSV